MSLLEADYSILEKGDPVPVLIEIMRKLRAEDGCPWDREQTLDSLRPYLLEETYEVLDAMDDDHADHHREELGDLLLQIVFQARIREEQGLFDFYDVVRTLSKKLVRRHPHVFGATEVSGSKDVLRNWETIKKTEKPEKKSLLDSLPRSMPPLQKAYLMQKKAACVGFDWERIEQVIDKVEEELGEVREALRSGEDQRIDDELGDLMFAMVNLSRFSGRRPHDLLEAGIAKFCRRFQQVERMAEADGVRLDTCSMQELDAYWERAKTQCQKNVEPKTGP